MSITAPRTFLELVQRSSMECGLAGDPPSTLVGAEGEILSLANYMNQSWIELQSKHVDWDFMLLSPGVSFATVGGQTIYTPTQAGVVAGEISSWKLDTFRSYNTAAGTNAELHMEHVPYDVWRDAYNFGALRNAQVPPMVFSVHPNLSLAVQCPLAGYTITGDYYHVPIDLEDDTDEPAIPFKYRMLLVYATMKSYGAYESAPEVYDRGHELYTALMNKLENDRLPQIMLGGSLA